MAGTSTAKVADFWVGLVERPKPPGMQTRRVEEPGVESSTKGRMAARLSEAVSVADDWPLSSVISPREASGAEGDRADPEASGSLGSGELQARFPLPLPFCPLTAPVVFSGVACTARPFSLARGRMQ